MRPVTEQYWSSWEDTQKWQEAVSPLLEWFKKNARILPWREEPLPYRVWVSEIMLQQTRVEAVKPYFARFIKELPDIPALAGAAEEQLLKLWEGLGYYSRVRNLQRAAQIVMEQYGGKLPACREELLKLPGIGSYTAGAIASIAYGIPVPAVDGNVLRVYARVTAMQKSISEPAVKKAVEKGMESVMPQKHAGAFNQALMELGATVCLPGGVPKCEQCPLEFLCAGHALGIAEELPVKDKKKPRRIEEKTVLLLVCGGEAALQKRPPKGLLAGLWEFPCADGFLGEEGAREVLEQWEITPLSFKELPPAKHVFSHVEWHMHGWWVEVTNLPLEFARAGQWKIQHTYALPSAYRAYLECFIG